MSVGLPGNRHFFVHTKSGAAAKMLGDVVRAYWMPTAGAHQPIFFPFGVERKPYTNDCAKLASLNIRKSHDTTVANATPIQQTWSHPGHFPL